MTNAASNASPPFFANAEIIVLEPAEVHVPDRIGFLHDDKAVALGKLMAADGQRDPIKVRARKPTKTHPQEWELIAGLHRLTGAQMVGILIYALEVVGDDALMREIEASENIHRRDFEPLERAAFTGALMTAAQERIAKEHGDIKQQALAIKLRWQRVNEGVERREDALTTETSDTCATMAHVYGWEESAGDAMGISRRSIHRDLTLYRLIIQPLPDLVEPLSKHAVVGSNAKALQSIARIRDEKTRRTVIEFLIAYPAATLENAMSEVGLGSGPDATPVAHQKHYNAISGGWSRLSLSEQNRFLPRLAALLTDGQKRELRDQIDRELAEGNGA